jgi:hypothetical protein
MNFSGILAICSWVILTMLQPVCVGGELREWRNREGTSIRAEYVSSHNDGVTIRMNGREFVYPLADLSDADQEYVREQQAALARSLGWHQGIPIDVPAYPDLEGYLNHPNAKRVYEAFDEGTSVTLHWDEPANQARERFDYERASARMHVYVPGNYDGRVPFGIYLHISPGNQGAVDKRYEPLMEKMKLIYVSPMGTSNGQPMLRRVRLAIDALASVKSRYRIDDTRVVVGGLSGGGHMAMLTHAMFPDFFIGSVSHAAQSYLPSKVKEGHFPGFSLDRFRKSLSKGRKWCVISGERDQNYRIIIEESKPWMDYDMPYRFIDVPGMGHTRAPPEALEEALRWILPGEE